MYQLHAYAVAYQCDELALIYPWHEGLADSRETAFQFAERAGRRATLHVVCVDVAGSALSVLRGRESLFGRLLSHNAASAQ